MPHLGRSGTASCLVTTLMAGSVFLYPGPGVSSPKRPTLLLCQGLPTTHIIRRAGDSYPCRFKSPCTRTEQAAGRQHIDGVHITLPKSWHREPLHAARRKPHHVPTRRIPHAALKQPYMEMCRWPKKPRRRVCWRNIAWIGSLP